MQGFHFILVELCQNCTGKYKTTNTIRKTIFKNTRHIFFGILIQYILIIGIALCLLQTIEHGSI